MKIEGLGGPPKPKGKVWSWSYSKLKNFEVCPRKHYEVDLAKTFAEATSTDPDSALNWGNRVHDEFKKALQAKVPLPADLSPYQHWVDRLLNGPGELFVEQKYAINKNFAPVSWFDPDAWVRMIGDAVRIDSPFTDRHGNRYRVGLVVDWKTGKILDDSVQLMLMAQALFSTYPDLTHVRSEFVWLKDDCTTPEVFTRQEVAEAWTPLLARVHSLENAHITQTYPPKPGGLCKNWCPVQSCPYWKKGA